MGFNNLRFKYTFFFFLLLNISCASLPKGSKQIPKASIQNNQKIFNGTFSVNISYANHGEINRIIEIINRNSTEWPDIKVDNRYTLSVELIDNENIHLILWKDNEQLIGNRIKFKEKKNYIYLRNKNIKLHNIPFILGGYDLLRARMTVTKEGNLIVDTVSYGIGSLLFFIWSGTPKMQSSNTYKRTTS